MRRGMAVLAAGLIFGVAGAAPVGQVSSVRPNIVLILADDLGFGDIAPFGSESVKTPSLDRLAAEGIRFTDFHSNGSVCTPTRAALLTGNYQQRAGLESVIYVGERTHGLSHEQATLPAELRKHGYATAIFGKWHLGFPAEYHPLTHGFDEFRGFLSGNVDYISHRDGSNRLDWWHNREPIDERGYTTDVLTDRAVQFIEQNKGRPFFLYIAHAAPHDPFQGRTDPAIRLPGGGRGPVRSGEADRKRAYREMLEAMDEGIGRVLQALTAAGLDGRTLVFFASDNGAVMPVGSNGVLRGAKGTLWEGGHRVPALARFPGRIEPGSHSDDLMLTMDLFPTLLSVAGVTERPRTDGIDAGEALRGTGRLPERTVFWRSGDQKAARKGPWKYVEMDGSQYLFNLAQDLSERHNLVTTEAVRVAELKRGLEAWEVEMSKHPDKSQH